MLLTILQHIVLFAFGFQKGPQLPEQLMVVEGEGIIFFSGIASEKLCLLQKIIFTTLGQESLITLSGPHIKRRYGSKRGPFGEEVFQGEGVITEMRGKQEPQTT